MKPPVRRSSAVGRMIVPILIFLAVVAALVLTLRQPTSKTSPQPTPNVQAPVTPSNSPSQSPMARTAALPAASAGGAPSFPDFQKRPLPVALENSNFQWTAADGKDTNIIRRLAHNELEYQRMVEENGRIKRRQLVYSKNLAAAVMERSRLTGEPVRQFSLPGFDGQELQFAIERADLEPSKQIGTFTGRLVGRPDSLVTMAFKFGRESFSVASPEDGTYLQSQPREPGEIILTSFDPDTYLPLSCGEPIKTSK